MIYTYTIFDANPHTSGDVAWAHATQVEVEATSDAAAVHAVEKILCNEANGLHVTDGYAVGQTLYALVWSDE